MAHRGYHIFADPKIGDGVIRIEDGENGFKSSDLRGRNSVVHLLKPAVATRKCLVTGDLKADVRFVQ